MVKKREPVWVHMVAWILILLAAYGLWGLFADLGTIFNKLF